MAPLRLALAAMLAGASYSLPSLQAVDGLIDAVLGSVSTYAPGDCHWERATALFGVTEALLAANSTAGAKLGALNWATAWAESADWECGGSFQPNDFGGGWGFANLYRWGPAADYKLALGLTMQRLLAAGPSALPPYSWWWVDTTAMNVPQWVTYAVLLGEPALLDLAAQQFAWTRDGGPAGAAGQQPGLWSPSHGLWWRDHTYVNASSPNGSPVFWGRGNGWAGIMAVKTLDSGALPAGHPLIATLQGTITTMAAALAPLQGSDGLWRSNLLDPAQYPNPETSGTGGIAAMLAYGLRAGLLQQSTYEPVLDAAWAGLTNVSVTPDGALHYCQPVGASPGPAGATDTSDFCAGFVLLAAAEMRRLLVARGAAAQAAAPAPAAFAAASSPSTAAGAAITPSASAAAPWDLTLFETELLPAWVQRFAVPSEGPGAFSYTPHASTSCAYGSAGVIHALSVVGQLNLTNTEAAVWAQHIGNFQNASTGLYNLSPPEMGAGYQPWHAPGWIGAALRLLGQPSRYPPVFSQTVALGGEGAWNSTFPPLLTDPAGVWSRSHKIAALPTVLMMYDARWSETYAPFFSWFWAWLRETASPEWGYWCLAPNPQPPNTMCLGGAFHIYFTLQCGGQPFPDAAAALNTTLALQNPVTGLWGGDRFPSYMDQDGVVVTSWASQQLGRARWDEVQTMCQRFLATAVPLLNNATEVLGDGSPYGGIVHTLAGIVTSVAECATLFPQLVTTVRPWRNTVPVGCFG